MANDDMHVVMYKILAYLYSCLKKGEEPIREHYSHDGDVLHIPYPYWEKVMRTLAEHGYIEGVTFVRDMNGDPMLADCEPEITMEGVAFMQENTAMKRALDFLREVKCSLPFI